MRGTEPDQLAALRLLLAALDDDQSEAERIYLETGPVPLILGLVAAAIGLGEHAHRSRASLRQTLLGAAQAVEINSISIEQK